MNIKHLQPASLKVFGAFIQKEFRHILRDRWTTIILLLLPVVMLLLFGNAINTEVRNTHLVVYDASNDEATRQIIEKLKLNEYFIFDGYLQSSNEIHRVFQKGKVGLALVFSDHFYEQLKRTGTASVQLIADGSDPNTALTVTNYATAIILSVQGELMGGIQPPPLQIKTTVKLLYNPTMKSAYNFVPGIMGMILLLVCAMMTSISIAREKEQGTMEVLLVSPVKPIYILLAKAIPYFILSLVDLAIILLIAVYGMQVPIAGSFFWLMVISLIYIFLALALGLLISSLVSKQDAALLISGMALMIPVILLSGMMFPVENMPWFLKGIGQAIPAKWYISAVRKLMIKRLGVGSVLTELTVLTGMAITLIVIALKTFKNKLE